MKTISYGRRHQNIKRWISQQPLFGSSSNFKLKLLRQNQNKNAWNEDNLKILKEEYVSIPWLDLPQILNLHSGDQTKIKNTWNEDDL